MATESERSLAAILAADVGYWRLMAADEKATLAALKALPWGFIDPRITKNCRRVAMGRWRFIRASARRPDHGSVLCGPQALE
jgi:hypothetical protein